MPAIADQLTIEVHRGLDWAAYERQILPRKNFRYSSSVKGRAGASTTSSHFSSVEGTGPP
jgi:hypothetical protein